MSLHSEKEDLYSLLKDLLSAIKGLTTAQIDTAVTGSSKTGGSVEGTGKNAGVGLNAETTQKLDELAQRLEKLLQQGQKPSEEAERQREAQQAQEKQQDQNAQKHGQRYFGKAQASRNERRAAPKGAQTAHRDHKVLSPKLYRGDSGGRGATLEQGQRQSAQF